MCFYFHQTKEAVELEHRFNAKLLDKSIFKPQYYTGFNFPKTPVITNVNKEIIQEFNWGLIPFWAKDNSIRKNTLNARIETLKEKVSFKSVLKNRCLVIANGFFEWQWLDEKGKKKQKYLINLNDDKLFAFAGLWGQWTDKNTGEIINTYTIITTQANKLMSEIHNTKKRMPVILSENSERSWLESGEFELENDRLIAEKIS